MLALILAATLSIEDYATLPQLSAPRLSPDGKRVAYVVTRADLARSAYDSDVWLVNADGSRNVQLTRAGGSDGSPRWSPDGTQVAFLSDRVGTSQVFVISSDFGEARQVTSEPSAVRELAWAPDGKSIAFTRPEEVTAEEKKRTTDKDDARVVGQGKKHVHLHLADVESGKVRRLTSGDFSVLFPSWSPDGKAIAFARTPGIGLDDYYRSDLWTVTIAAEPVLTPLVARAGFDALPSWSPDGKSIAFVSAGGRDEWMVDHRLFVVPAGGGVPRDLGRATARAERLVWSADSRTLWFEAPRGSTTQLNRINADGTASTVVTDVDGMVEEIDVRGDRTAWIQQSLTEPPELYVNGQRVTSHNAAYRDRTLGETRILRWKNPQDGLEIEGLLTLPVSYKPGTRVPLLTFVHGGPASRFNRGYLGYLGSVYAPQVMAANGFAVLRPNPRGTGGYSESFLRANFYDWGGMDWLDINAGIDRVIADGVADPSRLGMMGWSYGGYMAAWAVGHSDRFRAISIGAPVVDLLSQHGTADTRDFLPAYFGRPFDPDLLRARSPMHTLKKTAAKVLIQHGEADDRVPPTQGTMLYRALDELGVDVQMVTYPRTPHTAREPKLRMDVMRRNVDFFSFLLAAPVTD